MDNKLDFSLHDAELLMVRVDRIADCIQLEFRHENGELTSLYLEGIRAFRCEDLKCQNVVSRLLLSSKGQIRPESYLSWFEWVTSLSDSSSSLKKEKKQEWYMACEAGELELLVLEPSAGAQLAVVCHHIRLNYP